MMPNTLGASLVPIFRPCRTGLAIMSRSSAARDASHRAHQLGDHFERGQAVRRPHPGAVGRLVMGAAVVRGGGRGGSARAEGLIRTAAGGARIDGRLLASARDAGAATQPPRVALCTELSDGKGQVHHDKTSTRLPRSSSNIPFGAYISTLNMATAGDAATFEQLLGFASDSSRSAAPAGLTVCASSLNPQSTSPWASFLGHHGS